MAPAPEHAELFHDCVYAGLDALRASVLLDLCAYVHQVEGGGHQLWLRAPELGSLDEEEANELLTRLRALLEELTADGPRESAVELCGFTGWAVASLGPHSRGLHVMGRDSGPVAQLDAHEREVVSRLGRALAAVHHALETALGVAS
jgi:hypothetical protein